MRLNALDTFSGIGGFALGFERVGINTVAFCEKERYCRAVLARRWPGRPCFPDIKAIDADGLGRLGLLDIVSGGVPCQPASLAGNRRGSSDDRWLWPEFFEVVRLSRAPWALAENPLGLLSLKPHGLAWVCGTFHELGYDAWPIIVSAHDVGAPHLRRRIWIVAHSHSNQLRNNQQRAAGRRDDVQDRGHTEPRDDGAKESVADGDSGRLAIERLAQHAAEQGTPGSVVDGRDPGRWRDGPADTRGAETFGTSEADADAKRQRLEGILEAGPAAQAVDRSRDGGDSARWWWDVEPDVGRVVHGVPHRVDRIRALGNACIPQIVEAFGRAIIEADRSMRA